MQTDTSTTIQRPHQHITHKQCSQNGHTVNQERKNLDLPSQIGAIPHSAEPWNKSHENITHKNHEKIRRSHNNDSTDHTQDLPSHAQFSRGIRVALFKFGIEIDETSLHITVVLAHTLKATCTTTAMPRESW